jgi:hypothetical protein
LEHVQDKRNERIRHWQRKLEEMIHAGVEAAENIKHAMRALILRFIRWQCRVMWFPPMI